MVSQSIREGKIADEGGGVQSYMYQQLQMYACSVYKIHCKIISKVEISNLRAFFGDMYFIVLWYFIILRCLYSLPLFLLPSTHIFLFHSKCNYLFLACHCQFLTISRQYNKMFNKLWCDWMFQHGESVLLKGRQCYRDKLPADVNTLWFYDRLTIYQHYFQFNSIRVNEDFRENSWQEKHVTFNLA